MYPNPSDISLSSKIYALNLPFWKSAILNSELKFFWFIAYSILLWVNGENFT